MGTVSIINYVRYIKLQFVSTYHITCMYILCRYEYKVCPFHNVTQKEETNRWGRYHGVLGFVVIFLVCLLSFCLLLS